jgi:hypothetical protein
MSSERPIRSTRVKPAPPILPEIMARINTLDGKYYEQIRTEFNKVAMYFKDDTDYIANFWLTHYKYDLEDFKHQFLLRSLLNVVGLKHPKVLEFLNAIPNEETLMQLAVVRVNNGKKVFYRIRVGINT